MINKKGCLAHPFFDVKNVFFLMKKCISLLDKKGKVMYTYLHHSEKRFHKELFLFDKVMQI